MSTRITRSSCAAACLGMLAGAPAIAGQGIITANPHRVGCDATAPPQATLAAHPDVNANAYHTHSSNPGCIVDTILNRRELRFEDYDKPKIISSDGAVDHWTNATAQTWINRIAAAPGEHYEHYEQYFGRTSCSDPACGSGTNGCRGLPMEGIVLGNSGPIINERADLPACTLGTTSTALRNALGNQASSLVQNGTLTQAGRDFYWTGNPASAITLMGYSWMGALTGGLKLDVDGRYKYLFDNDGYLDALKSYGSRGINLTRVWAVEQWTALEVERNGTQPIGGGLTPFVFGGAPARYDLGRQNPRFFQRLRAFAQAAADRGIVVQLSLFDKHGLIEPACEGKWKHSPYRDGNNAPQLYLPNDLDGCSPLQACVENPPPPCEKPRPEFIDWENPQMPIGAVHDAYIRRVAAEVGGLGNVMFEVANEILPGDFGPAGEQWQMEVAERLRAALPDRVVRDAFNGDANGLGLPGKPADPVDPAQSSTWTASNARISSGPVGSRALLMGKVVSQTADGQGGPDRMEGALKIDTWGAAAVSVRATVTSAFGHTGVGLRDTTGDAVTALSADIWHAVWAQAPELRLRRWVGGTPSTLAAVALAANGHINRDVRLTVDLGAQVARVYVDGEELLVHDLPLEVVPTHPFEAFFRGQTNGPTPYTVANGAIDNFEAATF